MRDHEEFELDRAAAAAWTRFQARLGDRLAELAEDEALLVEATVGDHSEPGTAAYVQFCAWGEGMLRAEASSNHVLAASREIDERGEEVLGVLGYGAPTYGPDDEADGGSLNFHVDLPQSEADRLAVMSVRALREVFGVAHPALLSGDVVEDLAAPVEPAAFERTDEPVAAYPHGGHAELVALVDRALIPYFGHEPRHDDDGDIPVDLGDNVLFVRVHEAVPVVELFCCLAVDVDDLVRASFEIDVLNRDVQFVKFRLVGSSILADLQLPAWPFVPEHLRAMLALMTESIQQVQDDLLARVNGSSLLSVAQGSDDEEEDEEDDDGDDDELEDESGEQPVAGQYAELILAQLNAESPGCVKPEVAASICGHDIERILDMITGEECHEISWRSSRDHARSTGDVEGAAACEAEMAYARDTKSLLRRALRVLVERQAASDAAQPTPPVVRRRARRHPPRPPRPNRVPDPTLEEVDPEIWG